MRRAALGIRMHCGWGVLVAVSGGPNSLEIIDRRRIVITAPAIPGANQPYHYAASLGLLESETYLANYAAASERRARAEVEKVVGDLDGSGYRIAGAAVLMASGRPLPSLAKILTAHPLIHTAEGEFFRHAVSHACQDLKISITAIRERDLDEQAKTAFGNVAGQVHRRIAGLGSSIGPPWTKDHKAAALAAAMILARESRSYRVGLAQNRVK